MHRGWNRWKWQGISNLLVLHSCVFRCSWKQIPNSVHNCTSLYCLWTIVPHSLKACQPCYIAIICQISLFVMASSTGANPHPGSVLRNLTYEIRKAFRESRVLIQTPHLRVMFEAEFDKLTRLTQFSHRAARHFHLVVTRSTDPHLRDHFASELCKIWLTK